MRGNPRMEALTGRIMAPKAPSNVVTLPSDRMVSSLGVKAYMKRSRRSAGYQLKLGQEKAGGLDGQNYRITCL
jgi:hypothetical protein